MILSKRGFKFVAGFVLGLILLIGISLISVSDKYEWSNKIKESLYTRDQIQEKSQEAPQLEESSQASDGRKDAGEVTVAIPVKVEVTIKKPKEILKIPNGQLSEVDQYLISEQGQELFGQGEGERSLSGEEVSLGPNPTELEVESHDFAKKSFKTEW